MALTRPSIPYEVPREEPVPHIDPVELPEPTPVPTPAREEPVPA